MKQTSKLAAIFLAGFLFIGTFLFGSFPVRTKNNQMITNEKVVINKTNVDEKVQTQVHTLVKKAENNNKVNLPSSEDDKLITILLLVLLGGFAAHRWYKKKPIGWNILFILTGGGCGVWAIIDLINIITDKF